MRKNVPTDDAFARALGRAASLALIELINPGSIKERTPMPSRDDPAVTAEWEAGKERPREAPSVHETGENYTGVVHPPVPDPEAVTDDKPNAIRSEHADWCPRALHVDCCRVEMCECGAGAVNAELDRLREKRDLLAEAIAKLAKVRDAANFAARRGLGSASDFDQGARLLAMDILAALDGDR